MYGCKSPVNTTDPNVRVKIVIIKSDVNNIISLSANALCLNEIEDLKAFSCRETSSCIANIDGTTIRTSTIPKPRP